MAFCRVHCRHARRATHDARGKRERSLTGGGLEWRAQKTAAAGGLVEIRWAGVGFNSGP